MAVKINTPTGKTVHAMTTKGDDSFHYEWATKLGEAPHANINVHLGARIGLPNYSDARCGASITVPCDMNPDAIESAYNYAYEWVTSKMEQLTEEITSG